MRTRKEILENENIPKNMVTCSEGKSLEVLLDIRDLLIKLLEDKE